MIENFEVDSNKDDNRIYMSDGSQTQPVYHVRAPRNVEEEVRGREVWVHVPCPLRELLEVPGGSTVS